jgi:hypothetical protein
LSRLRSDVDENRVSLAAHEPIRAATRSTRAWDMAALPGDATTWTLSRPPMERPDHATTEAVMGGRIDA